MSLPVDSSAAVGVAAARMSISKKPKTFLDCMSEKISALFAGLQKFFSESIASLKSRVDLYFNPPVVEKIKKLYDKASSGWFLNKKDRKEISTQLNSLYEQKAKETTQKVRGNSLKEMVNSLREAQKSLKEELVSSLEEEEADEANREILKLMLGVKVIKRQPIAEERTVNFEKKYSYKYTELTMKLSDQLVKEVVDKVIKKDSGNYIEILEKTLKVKVKKNSLIKVLIDEEVLEESLLTFQSLRPISVLTFEATKGFIDRKIKAARDLAFNRVVSLDGSFKERQETFVEQGNIFLKTLIPLVREKNAGEETRKLAAEMEKAVKESWTEQAAIEIFEKVSETEPFKDGNRKGSFAMLRKIKKESKLPNNWSSDITAKAEQKLAEALEARNKAATGIQKTFRGYQVRNRLKEEQEKNYLEFSKMLQVAKEKGSRLGDSLRSIGKISAKRETQFNTLNGAALSKPAFSQAEMFDLLSKVANGDASITDPYIKYLQEDKQLERGLDQEFETLFSLQQEYQREIEKLKEFNKKISKEHKSRKDEEIKLLMGLQEAYKALETATCQDVASLDARRLLVDDELELAMELERASNGGKHLGLNWSELAAVEA